MPCSTSAPAALYHRSVTSTVISMALLEEFINR